MFARILVAAFSVSQMPAPLALPKSLAGRPVHAGLQATHTHFVAENLSLSSQLLLFGSQQQGVFASVTLPPLQRLAWPFADGASDDVLVELVQLSPRTWSNSGALSIRNLGQEESGTMWVETAREYAIGWARSGDGLRHVLPRTGLLPSGARRVGLRVLDAPPGATHVPVITPDDDRQPPRPPKVDEKPLPPV